MSFRPRRARGFGLAALGLLAWCCVAAAPASAGRSLRVGFGDPLFTSSDAGLRGAWLDRSAEAGASVVRINVHWAAVVGSQPASPRDPGDPSYDFDSVDASVGSATQRGLDVVLTVYDAPSWAEGKHRPGSAPAGTWRPRPGALGDFAHALAERYSGLPGLPRVRYFQAWNEENLSNYLTPQWRGGRPFAPDHYRKMLNAFYRGVHSAVKRDKVLTGGTAPYGDPSHHGDRMQPARFWRSLLCLRGHRLRTARCKRPAHLDIAAHHPINIGPPTRHAFNRDDISTPDIGKLKRILRRAQHTGRLLPRGHKPVWATEIWWDSKPPDPNGIRLRTQARWLELAFYVLWRQSVKSVIWLQIRDAPPNPSYSTTLQSGVFFLDGDPKPALHAFRFPFVGDRVSRRRVRVWGKAPVSGRVAVQVKRRHSWHTVKHLRAGGTHVFTGTVRLHGKGRLRARSEGDASLPWRQG